MNKLIYLCFILCFSNHMEAQNLVDLFKKVNSSVAVLHTINSVSAGSGDKQKVNTDRKDKILAEDAARFELEFTCCAFCRRISR